MDYAAVYSALYDRAATDSAGAAFRATLGALFPATDLAQWREPTTPGRPARVWAVWRPGAIGGASGDMRPVGASWWLYDDPERGNTRINTALSALEALYGIGARDAIPFGRLRVTFIGPTFHDDALGLTGREVRIVYDRRG